MVLMSLRYIQLAATSTLYMLALFIMAATSASSTCPAGCHCNFTTPNPRVICPPPLQQIPSGLSSDVRALVLQGSPTSQNVIGRLTKSSLSQMPDLLELRLPFSGVVGLEHGVLGSMPGLKIVDLQHNAVTLLDSDTFAGLHDLEYLDLTGNSGCVLDTGIFSGLSKLRTLLLGETDLGVLRRDLFSDLTALIFLDLHGNTIHEIKSGVVTPMKSLEHLDLRYNDLEALSSDLETFVSGLKRLQLARNPWRCNCEARWLKSLPAISPQGPVTLVHGSDVVVCSSPPALRFQSLALVPAKEMTCTPPTVTSCSGPHTVTLGDEVTLACTTGVSDPDPDITWISPEGQQAQNDTHYVTSRTGNTWSLVISAAEEKDDGNWSVTATNRHGMDNATVEVHVIVPSTSTTATTSSPSVNATSRSEHVTTMGVSVRKASGEDIGFYIAIGALSAVAMVTVVISIVAACRARAKSRQQVAPQTSRITVREASDVILLFRVFTRPQQKRALLRN